MANDLNNKDCTSFWKEAKNVTLTKYHFQTKWDVTGEHEISKNWKQHYCTLLNK